ncbi:acyltransferase [Neorhizobium lilium]|uniref:Acyltransferase n=2 Tax=Neorhizobium lilium TaxID=2503024 RepID=A0A444LKB9_9HYPH|nr:acyltransferase [Neorhizobium lilium]
MRILLICGIVFVHVPSNDGTSQFLGANGLFDWLRVFLGDSLFRIGVPCLSAISGYLLFVRGMEKFDYGTTLWSKARTVLLPFLLWNCGLFITVLVIQRADMGIGYFHDLWNSSPRELLTYAFAIEDFPVNVPLYFLRDLLVCILLSPLLALCVRRAPLSTLAVLFLIAVVPDVPVGIVLKKSILFSFTFGIYLALNKVDLRALDRFALPGTLAVLLAAGVLSIGLYRTGPDFPWFLDLALNALSIVGAGGFWLVSALAIRTRLSERLAATGSLSFWIFCAHYPLLVVMWMIWNRAMADSLYPVFYLGAVATSFIILVGTNWFVSHAIPSLYQVLTGSRGRKEKMQTPAKRQLPTPYARHGEPPLSHNSRGKP